MKSAAHHRPTSFTKRKINNKRKKVIVFLAHPSYFSLSFSYRVTRHLPLRYRHRHTRAPLRFTHPSRSVTLQVLPSRRSCFVSAASFSIFSISQSKGSQ
ncbi:hypothetical protein SDJN03_22388, partial [Cucurbita argyrosperma subsp. sororia]